MTSRNMKMTKSESSATLNTTKRAARASTMTRRSTDLTKKAKES